MRPVLFAALATLLGFVASSQAQSPIDVFSLPHSGNSGGGLAPIAPHERALLSADAAALVASNTRFGLNIYHDLSSAAKPSDNVLISPFSISAALAMTYAGAHGQTAQQMANVLQFTLPDPKVHPAFSELLRDLATHRDGYQLDVANRLFGQQGYPFEIAFRNITATDYGAPLEEVDFRTNTEAARGRINQWVEDQTNDKIRDLLPAGSVKDNTRLVFTNAIYFNG